MSQDDSMRRSVCGYNRSMAHILCVGLNDALMATRKLILERAGHVVHQTKDLRGVPAACENPIRVVVIGNSLKANEKMRVTDVVRTHCKEARILELHTDTSPDLPSAHAHLRVVESHPEGLIEAVNALIPKARKAKSEL